MPTVHVITHPEVVIDPAVPVPDWPLSAEGIRRTTVALEQPWMQNLGSLFTSAERKATDTAHIIAQRFSLSPVTVPDLAENDRSATGYLAKAEFEATAGLFFSRPTDSIRGWERAIGAQQRIVAAVNRIIAAAPNLGEIAIVSHGGVATLLLCHLKRIPISRAEDQPGAGGGNVFTFETTSRILLSAWRRIEDPFASFR